MIVAKVIEEGVKKTMCILNNYFYTSHPGSLASGPINTHIIEVRIQFSLCSMHFCYLYVVFRGRRPGLGIISPSFHSPKLP